MSSRFPPARAHGPLREVLPGLHLVKGSFRLGPITMSRNMTVIARGDDLVLVNSVRLDPHGLAQLDALGRVTDVIRLAAAHGSDDPFYKDRYGATVWDIEGQRYFEGTDARKGKTYFVSDHALGNGPVPPLPGARSIRLSTQPPEGLLLLPHGGGTLVSGDVLHHWARGRDHFNLVGRVLMRGLGFVGPHRIGKGWLDACAPDPAELEALLELPFAHVLPAHGDPVLGDAPAKYRHAVQAYAERVRGPRG